MITSHALFALLASLHMDEGSERSLTSGGASAVKESSAVIPVSALKQMNQLKEQTFNEETLVREAIARRIVLGEGNPWRSYSLAKARASVRTSRVEDSAARENLHRKLETIILPEWQLAPQTELSEAVKKLHQLALANDPEHAGVPFMILNNTAPPLTISEPSLQPTEDALVTIEQPMQNARLLDAIKAVAGGARWGTNDSGRRAIEYQVQECAIVFQRAGENRPARAEQPTANSE